MALRSRICWSGLGLGLGLELGLGLGLVLGLGLEIGLGLGLGLGCVGTLTLFYSTNNPGRPPWRSRLGRRTGSPASGRDAPRQLHVAPRGRG